MRFQGNIVENLQAAAKSQDEILMKELLVDAIANIIENNPKQMIKTLRYSNVKVNDTSSKGRLIDLAAYNLYNNTNFQKNLAVTLTMGSAAQKHDYTSANGGGGGQGGGGGGQGGSGQGGGGGGGNIVSSIADMIGSIGKWGASANDLKAEESRTKSKMYEKIFGGQQKTNWMPIIVVTGVLLIGALVVWRTTAKNA